MRKLRLAVLVAGFEAGVQTEVCFDSVGKGSELYDSRAPFCRECEVSFWRLELHIKYEFAEAVAQISSHILVRLRGRNIVDFQGSASSSTYMVGHDVLLVWLDRLLFLPTMVC